MFLRLAFRNINKGHAKLYQRVIAWWTGGPYCHVELWFDGPVDKAFTYSSLEGEGTRFINQDISDYDWVSITEVDAEAYEVYKYCARRPRFKYDYVGLLGFTGPFKIHDASDRFCSEICYETLDENGFLKDPEARWKVSPNELARKIVGPYGPLNT